MALRCSHGRPSGGPPASCCCSCSGCCSCYCCEAPSGEASLNCSGRATRQTRPGSSCCMHHACSSCAHSAAPAKKLQACSRGEAPALCSSGLTASAHEEGAVCSSRELHVENEEEAAAAAKPAAADAAISHAPDGCGSPHCIMTESLRPRRICICMVSDFFFPSLGGVEMHIYELSVRLARKGFKIIVLTHAIDGRHGIRYLTEGIKCAGRTILVREKVDIVHGHQTTSTLAHESMFHARHLGYRVVYTDHSMFSFADAACIHMNKVFKFFLTHCDHCICVSHTHKENLVLRGALNPHQVAVINNAVDVPAYVPDLSKRPPPPAINILILSRLSYRKGIDLLVDMIPAVCAKYPNVTFIIGGDGPKRIILEEMKEKHRIHDRIEMLGAVPHGQACAFLQRGQIFLNASLTESFCIAIVEAAACGLVVVSTDVGGIPEVLPPDMVLLASPNPAALTLQLEEAIRRVEKGDIDPHVLHQRVLDMYSWEDVAERVEQVYFSALFGLPMSANLRKDISLSNVRLPPHPPPLPQPQEAVHVFRALNRCGPFSGKFFALVAIVNWCLIRLVEWLFPRSVLCMHASSSLALLKIRA